MASDLYLNIWSFWSTELQMSAGKPVSILRGIAEIMSPFLFFLVVCSVSLFGLHLDFRTDLP